MKRAFPDGLPPRMPLAPRMPDGHKVVEHVFPNLKSSFFKKLIDVGAANIDSKKAQDLLVEVFESKVTADSISHDTQTLPLTMKMIAKDKGKVFEFGNGQYYTGTGGGWPPKRFR